MKVLSLLQPWATLVVMGVKQIETRSWSTAHRGPILIHASLEKAGAIFAEEPPFKKNIPFFKQLPFGFIIGRVTLTNVIRIGTGVLFNTSDEMMNKLKMEEKAFGKITESWEYTTKKEMIDINISRLLFAFMRQL